MLPSRAMLVLLALMTARAAEPWPRVEGYEGPPVPALRAWEGGSLAWVGADGVLGRTNDAATLRDAATLVSGAAPRDLVCGADPRDGDASMGLMAAIAADGRVCVWSTRGDLVGIRPARRKATALGLGDDGSLAIGDARGFVEVRGGAAGDRRWRRGLDRGAIVGVDVDRVARRVIVGTADDGVAVLDLKWGRLIRAFAEGPVTAIAVAPHADHDAEDTRPRVAVGRPDGTVEVWDLRAWQKLDAVRLGDAPVVDLDWSSEGAMLAGVLDRGAEGARVVVRHLAAAEVVFGADLPAGPGPHRARFAPGDTALLASNGAVSRTWRRPELPRLPRRVELEPAVHREPRTPVPGPAALPPGEALPRGVVALSGDARAAVVAGDAGLSVARPGEAAVVSLAGSAGATGPVAFDGERVAAWVAGGVLLWDAASGAARLRIVEAVAPRGLAWTAGHLVIVRADGTVAVAAPGERPRNVPKVSGATAAVVDPARPSRLAIGTASGEVRVVDARTGVSESGWGVHTGAVTALAFEGDGARLATAAERAGGGARLVVLRREARAEEPPVAQLLDRAPRSLAFTGGWVLAADALGVVAVDAATGTVRLDRPGLVEAAVPGTDRVLFVEEGALRSVPLGEKVPWLPRGGTEARSADDSWAAVRDGDLVEVWDAVAGRRIRAVGPGPAAAREVALDPTGVRVAVGWADGTLEVYPAKLEEAPASLGEGRAPRFSPDGALVWALSPKGELVAWRAEDGKEEARIPVGAELAWGSGARFVEVRSCVGTAGWIDLAGEHGFFVAGGPRPLAAIPGRIAVAEGVTVRFLDAKSRGEEGRTLRVDGASPVAAAVSADGKRLVVAWSDGFVRVHGARDGKVETVLDIAAPPRWGHPGGPPVALSLDETGRKVVVVDAHGGVRTWDVRLGYEDAALPARVGAVTRVRGAPVLATSDDGARLWTAGADGAVRVWDVATGAQTSLLGGIAGAALALDPTDNGAYLVAGGGDGTARRYDVVTRTQTAGAATWGAAVVLVAGTEDGRRFAGADEVGLVRAWDATHAVARWRAPAPPRSLAFDGADALLADAADGRHTLELASGADTVAPLSPAVAPTLPEDVARRAAAFGPVAAAIPVAGGWATAGDDGVVRLWGAEGLRATLVALQDGSWVADRADGVRLAGGSLRDATAPRMVGPR